ncbi:Phosphopentomutase [Seinonella peptonophila]|uniref:Phosphopentomutase n=1 Tax=Seinonella peptonophila TaxID=112248 RepID=A0A1M4Z946_9BACL|nr:phosphopentomutase [Seinonella peptonophila]SHF14515.1 Phosphopentomutase [Seinonella peptonophila]
MGKITLLVLDGFGIGAMEDCLQIQPSDLNAHTYKHIREQVCLQIPTLYRLGLGRLVDDQGVPTAAFGRSKLAHYGADTFMGHQELMGSRPGKPQKRLMMEVGDLFEQVLKQAGYQVTHPVSNGSVLLVNQAVVIGDNLESALGNIINVVCDLNQISFAESIQIGKMIRQHVDTSRVIVYGNQKTNIERILAAVKEKNPGQWGVDSPKAGVYGEGYQVMHLGYGVDYEKQFPTLAEQFDIPVYRIGKTADVVHGRGYADPVVQTSEVLKRFQKLYEEEKKAAAFLVNVQETDLAGHAEDVTWYRSVLETVDQFLDSFIPLLQDDDVLIITADHGNDPTIGHSNHTREYTPILVIGSKVQPVSIGTRSTMADIGATMSQFFQLPKPEFGTSFYEQIVMK